MALYDDLVHYGITPQLAKFFIENYDFPQEAAPGFVNALVDVLKPFNKKIAGWYPELFFPRALTEEKPTIEFVSDLGHAQIQAMNSVVSPYNTSLVLGPHPELNAELLPHELAHRNLRLSDRVPPRLAHSMRPSRYLAGGAFRIPPASSIVQQYVNAGYRGEELDEEHMAALYAKDILSDWGARVWDDPLLGRTFPDDKSREAYLEAAFGTTPRMESIDPGWFWGLFE